MSLPTSFTGRQCRLRYLECMIQILLWKSEKFSHVICNHERKFLFRGSTNTLFCSSLYLPTCLSKLKLLLSSPIALIFFSFYFWSPLLKAIKSTKYRINISSHVDLLTFIVIKRLKRSWFGGHKKMSWENKRYYFSHFTMSDNLVRWNFFW